MADETLLSIEGLNVSYGVSQVLFGIDIQVARGQIMALLGRNGAGKSTTFKAITGLLPVKSGKVVFADMSMVGCSTTRIARAGIGYVPEDRQVFPEHTVEDNLRIAAKRAADGSQVWTLSRTYEVFPILAERRHRRSGKLSGGEQQLLTIARTLMGNPDLVLLDEPSEGLAPIIVQEIRELISQLRDNDLSILMAEQNMHFCFQVATHATVIDKGEIRFAGTIESLRENEDVKTRYLSV